MEHDSAVPLSSCVYCGSVFPTSDIMERIDGGRTPMCPRCGVDAVEDGSLGPDELERRHVRGFGGIALVLDALRAESVSVHGWGQSLADSKSSLPLLPNSIVVLVGHHAFEVAIDAPDPSRSSWLVRVPTSVVVRVGDADPGRATRLHAAAIGRFLEAQSFTCAEITTGIDEFGEYHRALYLRTATRAADVGTVIKSIASTETAITPDPDDAFLEDFGDVASMQALADKIAAPAPTTEITPWGITIRGSDGRDIARVNGEGHGTFYVYLTLPGGFGAKAAKKRSETLLSWFENTIAPAWREQGFTAPRRAGVGTVDHNGERCWAVVITMSFVADADVAGRLAWARTRDVMRFPVTP